LLQHKMFANIVVIHSMQRASRRNTGTQKSSAFAKAKEEHCAEKARREVAASNTELPRLAGMLVEKHRGLLGGESDHLRWVVLDPREATLSLWNRPPREAGTTAAVAGSNQSATHSPRKRKADSPRWHVFGNSSETPRKVYPMGKLVAVDSNPTFQNIFLLFEGAESVSLVADRAEDFQQWMDAFALYDASRASAQRDEPEAHVLKVGKGDSLAGQPRCLALDGCVTPRRHLEPQTPRSFQAAYEQCRFAEPGPEPALGPLVDRVEPNPEPAPGYSDEEYDTGSMEAKSVMWSMGITSQTKGLSPR